MENVFPPADPLCPGNPRPMIPAPENSNSSNYCRCAPRPGNFFHPFRFLRPCSDCALTVLPPRSVRALTALPPRSNRALTAPQPRSVRAPTLAPSALPPALRLRYQPRSNLALTAFQPRSNRAPSVPPTALQPRSNRAPAAPPSAPRLCHLQRFVCATTALLQCFPSIPFLPTPARDIHRAS